MIQLHKHSTQIQLEEKVVGFQMSTFPFYLYFPLFFQKFVISTWKILLTGTRQQYWYKGGKNSKNSILKRRQIKTKATDSMQVQCTQLADQRQDSPVTAGIEGAGLKRQKLPFFQNLTFRFKNVFKTAFYNVLKLI